MPTAYAEALRRHGIDSSIVGQRPPLRWHDRDWVPEPDDLQVLVLGDDYVVGAGFEAALLDDAESGAGG